MFFTSQLLIYFASSKGGSRFAMFSQVEEDFDDVFTVGAVLIFLQEEGFFVTKTFIA